jgi:plasmid stabilization system protein ParE
MARTYTVEWAEPALLDAEDIVDYLVTEGGPRAAEALVEKIQAKTAHLEKLADRGRTVPELRREGIHNYRELILKPYRMVYRISGKAVVIVAFVDGRRDLGELLVARAMR